MEEVEFIEVLELDSEMEKYEIGLYEWVDVSGDENDMYMLNEDDNGGGEVDELNDLLDEFWLEFDNANDGDDVNEDWIGWVDAQEIDGDDNDDEFNENTSPSMILLYYLNQSLSDLIDNENINANTLLIASLRLEDIITSIENNF